MYNHSTPSLALGWTIKLEFYTRRDTHNYCLLLGWAKWKSESTTEIVVHNGCCWTFRCWCRSTIEDVAVADVGVEDRVPPDQVTPPPCTNQTCHHQNLSTSAYQSSTTNSYTHRTRPTSAWTYGNPIVWGAKALINLPLRITVPSKRHR